MEVTNDNRIYSLTCSL